MDGPLPSIPRAPLRFFSWPLIATTSVVLTIAKSTAANNRGRRIVNVFVVVALYHVCLFWLIYCLFTTGPTGHLPVGVM